jgi:hypothetical protein
MRPAVLEHGDLPPFQHGCSSKAGLRISCLGQTFSLRTHAAEAATSQARLYDAIQLLLHGPLACTNFQWSSYKQSDIRAAVAFLEAKGVDVHQAVAAGQYAERIQFTAVQPCGGAAYRACFDFHQRGQRHRMAFGTFSSAEAAAGKADCGLLVVQGLNCTTNFPASSCDEADLHEAGEAAIAQGVEAVVVERNLEAVEQVR